MSKEINKDNVVTHKKKAIRKLGDMFEAFINNPDPRYLKKADLMAYWIETYCDYIFDEERYDYTKVPKYKRGDVISVNFGFNVGSEHGGRHYAIVLDNDNLQSSKVITVIPLSSGTVEKTHNRDVYLGNELYDKLKAKYDKMCDDNEKEIQETIRLIEVINNALAHGDFGGNTQVRDEINGVANDLNNQLNNLYKEDEFLKRAGKEISHLKEGSRAMMEQITTISKMRIIKPKSSKDLLHGISFSDGAMDKINNKLKELYIFSNNS